MIQALFSQPNYLATKKMLEGTALRHQAIASNIANLENPDYRRLDLPTSFQSQLQRALQGPEPAQLAALQPELHVDPTAGPATPGGNNVNLEQELLALNQNMVEHTLETQLITGTLLKLRLAITGRSAG